MGYLTGTRFISAYVCRGCKEMPKGMLVEEVADCMWKCMGALMRLTHQMSKFCKLICVAGAGERHAHAKLLCPVAFVDNACA